MIAMSFVGFGIRYCGNCAIPGSDSHEEMKAADCLVNFASLGGLAHAYGHAIIPAWSVSARRPHGPRGSYGRSPWVILDKPRSRVCVVLDTDRSNLHEAVGGLWCPCCVNWGNIALPNTLSFAYCSQYCLPVSVLTNCSCPEPKGICVYTVANHDSYSQYLPFLDRSHGVHIPSTHGSLGWTRGLRHLHGVECVGCGIMTCMLCQTWHGRT